MYRYIIDVRYPKGIECEDPCTVHNFLAQAGYEPKILQDTYERTEVLVEFKTIKEADDFGVNLDKLKKELSSDCTIDCYIVTSKWRV